MLRRFIFSLALAITLTGQAGDKTLEQLDGLVRNRRQYDCQKREAIHQAHIAYERATDDNDRYNALRGMYEAYRSFRIDSALMVARKRLDIARRMGTRSKIASATINLAEGYVRSGDVNTALGILDTLDRSTLEEYHLKYRNGVYREAWRTKADNSILKSDRDEALHRLKVLTDSALRDSPGTTRAHYTLTAEKLCDAGLYKEAIATIEEANRRFDFSQDAAMMSTMGEIYLKSGEMKKAKECLAKSAILDLTAGTKEYRSLISLTAILFEDGDINRAFEYINCAFEDAEFSHASLRTAEIMKSMPFIDKAFHETQKEVVRRTSIFLTVAGILVLCLLLLVAWYVKALKAKRKILGTIRMINEELAEKNDKLAKADALKLHYVNILMKAYSEYISRLKSFRLKILRFMKTGQHQKVLDMVNSNEGGDIVALQSLFDEAFLSMFPDFISQVNRFMNEPIKLKEPNRLTPELRIIALIKLRISSTEEISGLFHYSNQTVYNLRSTIRGMINIPWEDFEKEIMNL